MKKLLWVSLALLSSFSIASAQETQSFPAERFNLTMDRYGIWGTEWGAVPNHGAWGLNLWGGYNNDPITLYQLSTRERVGALVHHRVGGSLSGWVALADHIQIGVDVPWVAYQFRKSVQPNITGGPQVPSLDKFGLGDVRVIPKFSLFKGVERFNVALIVPVTFPTGQEEQYLGENGVTVSPTLALSKSFGNFRLAGNVGTIFRENSYSLNLRVRGEMTAAAGVAYRANEDLNGDGLEVGASFRFATVRKDAWKFDAPFNANYAEVVGGLSYAKNNIVPFVGGGIGVAEGWGTPDFRLLGGVRFENGMGSDIDKDGILDGDDRCPTEPEDKDSFEDTDGCPDTDNDKDGILDVNDGAPNDPEDKDGFEDEDGVPDLDNDKDGIADKDDKCPDKAEVVNGVNDEDGCPDSKDLDGDGINDDVDQCKTDPEDKDGFEDEDGCPDSDNDKDGLLDTEDQCPNKPGPLANKGCPDTDRDGDKVVDRLDNCPDEPGLVKYQGCKKKQLVKLSEGKLEILDVVYFKTNKAVIRSRSYRLLRNVAAVIKNQPNIKLVRIEGHTDDRGKDSANQKLSEARAESVKTFLIQEGVNPARLEAVGYGETRPIQTNKTRRGRAANRRVEFVLPGAKNVKTERTGPTEDTIDS